MFHDSMRFREVFLAALVTQLCVVSCKQKPPAKPPPLKVQVVTAVARDVPIFQEWIGTLDGYPNAQIRAQVSGYLVKQDYAEGSAVKKGNLLFEIDPRPFQAILDAAVAKQAQDEAQQGKTELDVKRYTPLAKTQAVSQQELDDAVQANLGAQAAIKSDKAAVESATLNLGFCRIFSPVDGIAGTAQAQIGDLVGPGGSVLTTVSTVEPIRVYFSISEESYLAFSRQFTNAAQQGTYRADMDLRLILSDGSMYPSPGKWLFTSRQVDVNTGTLQIAAVFPNPDFVLRPGQYGRVRAKVETRRNAILLPQRAIIESQGSYQVATVNQTNGVHIKNIQVGDQIGNEWLINSGVEPSDSVIVEGGQKVKEGAAVEPQPYNTEPTNASPGAAKS
jgi:RND family efflux transporter MFP subunit